MVIRDVIQGRNGGQKFRNLLSKKMTKGREGGHKIGKMGRHCLWKAPKWMNLSVTYYKPTIYVLHTPILFFSGSCNVTGDSCEYNPVLSIAICGK